MEVPIDQIKPSPYQPRLTFDLEDIKGSIMRDGILVPLTVRKKDGYYELIDGERRWRIAKELGYETVPCTIIEADDESADRMTWKVNTLRKDYEPEEKARHWKWHQEEGMSIRGIARDHDESPQNVLAHLNVFKLPEKYQRLVWDRGSPLTVGHIQELGPLFGEAVPIGTLVKRLDLVIERKLTVHELRGVLKPDYEEIKKRRIEAAKEAVPKIMPEAKKPETPEELEMAAELLRREAERRKTPEQRAEEKMLKLMAQARKSLNSTLKKIDGAEEVIDVSVFREHFNKFERSLEQNPAEVREQLIALGKEVTETKKQRQKEIEEEKRRKEEEERKRRLEEERRRVREAERSQLEEELKTRLEAERKRGEEEAREKLRRNREFRMEVAEQMEREHIEEWRTRGLRKEAELLRAKEFMEQIELPPAPVVDASTMLSRRKVMEEKRLNLFEAKEWMIFTKSWFIHNPPPREKKEELHPAKFPESMIKDFIEFFTQPTEIVLDPFLGTGSTLVACDMCKRQGIGVEIEEKYAKVAMTRTKQPVIPGDARRLDELDILKDLKGNVDFAITSPPYWNMLKKSRGHVRSVAKIREELGVDVSYGGKPENLENIEDYDEYLDALCLIFSKVHKLLRPNRYLVVIIQNILTPEGEMEPVAWDLAKKLSGLFLLKQERIWCQDNKPLGCWGYPSRYVSNVHHHYCLVFERV